MQSKSLIDTDRDTDNYNEDLENWIMMRTFETVPKEARQKEQHWYTLDIMNTSNTMGDLIRQEHWEAEQLPWIQQNGK